MYGHEDTYVSSVKLSWFAESLGLPVLVPDRPSENMVEEVPLESPIAACNLC